MNKPAVLLLFALSLLLSPSLSATIVFDQNYASACQPPNGCAFDNSSVWVGNVIPTSSDDVRIRTHNTTIFPLIHTTPATRFRTLLIEHAAFIHGSRNSSIQAYEIVVGSRCSFTVSSGAKLSIESTLRLESGAFTIDQGGVVEGARGSTLLQSINSSLTLHSGKLLWPGSCTYNGFLSADYTSTLLCHNTTYSPFAAILNVVPTFSHLTIPPGLTYAFVYGLICDVLNISQYATVYINYFFDGTIATIEQGASLKIDSVHPGRRQPKPIGLSGEGSVTISSSFLSISATSPEKGVLKGSMLVGGTSVLHMTNQSVWHLVCIATQSGVKIDVTIYGDNLQIGHKGNGSTPFYGALHAVGKGITLLQNMVIVGQVTATNSILHINTFLVHAMDPWLIWNSSKIIFSGHLYTFEYIEIDSSSSLIVADPEVHIWGSIVNQGLVSIGSTRQLFFTGNFTQTNSGTLSVEVGNKIGMRHSEGALILNGTVEYNIGIMPFLHSQKYLIADVGKIRPSYAEARAHADSAIQRASLEFTDYEVYIVYTYRWRSDLPVWLWVLFVACFVEVCIVVGVIAVRYRRHIFQHPVINFFYAARIVNIWRILDLEPSARA